MGPPPDILFNGIDAGHYTAAPLPFAIAVRSYNTVHVVDRAYQPAT